MHVLLDLDGTLVNTNNRKFDDIKCGRDRNFALSDIPSMPGAEEFVDTVRQRGHSVTIVSDSHSAYVGPLAEKRFSAPFLALADKPNTTNLRAYLESEFSFPRETIPEEFLFVGDTKLDVQLARGCSIPSALVFLGMDDVPHDPFHNVDASWARRYMEGATYNCRSFAEVLDVLDSPAKHRLVLEDPNGTAAARLYTARNANDGIACVRGLGRQQQGPCDAYGAIGRYYKFGSEDRSEDFLQKTARDTSRYLKTEMMSCSNCSWDLVTCVADKTTTKPPLKMAKLLHALDVGVPKEELFEWSPDVTGSIRQEKNRAGRMQFIKRFVRLDTEINLRGKNVVVVDDQFTTGATAIAHIDMLLDAGVCNVLFVALFYIANEVPPEKVCPKCGKTTRIKYRKRDGAPFYSCVPPAYNGDGCGWMGNIDNGRF